MKIYSVFLLLLIFYSCSNNTSSVTGNKFNDPSYGGFEKSRFKEQETGPGLILIKGGYFSSKNKEEVLVPSFYMDVTEVTNHNWCEYLYWTKRVFTDFPVVYENATPNELVWQENGSYNDPMIENYLRHPAFRNYPIIGVSWLQANDFCAWRTDRVNENILIREKILVRNQDQQNNPFTTGAYLAGQYEEGLNQYGQMIDFDPSTASGDRVRDMGVRNIRVEDGILLPKYRLPTSAEWEYASNAFTKTGSSLPWRGNSHKNYNDNSFIETALENKTAFINPVNSQWPNDYGLYNMSGNVSEWVLDSYTNKNLASNYSPYSGQSLTLKKELNTEGYEKDKLDEVFYDVDGIFNYVKELEKERKAKGIQDSIEILVFNEVYAGVNRARGVKSKIQKSWSIREIIENVLPNIAANIQSTPNYELYNIELIQLVSKGISKFVINKPGNIQLRETSKEDELLKEYMLTDEMKRYIPNYSYEINETLKSNNKIFKGRNWRDTSDNVNERYLNKYLSSSTIGFRCAMDRLGLPSGVGHKNKKKKLNKNISYFNEGE